MKWLLLATHVPASGQRGGMVRYTVELARGLARQDLELHILADAAAADYWTELVPPEQIHTVKSAPTPVQSLLERSGKALPDMTFDVIHGTKHLLPKASAVRGAATVMTVHDLLPLDRPGDFGWVKRQLLPGPYLASAGEADHLVCISEATADRLRSYIPATKERIAIVPLANESQGLGSAQQQPLTGVESPFALVVGDPSPRKNVEFVTSLWPQVRRQIPTAQLVVVGPPSWGKHTVAADPGNGVQHHTSVSDAELAWCYANANVVLCPSLLEGFGLPAVEGLRAGAPVITSDDPALSEASGAFAKHLSPLDPAAWTVAITDYLRTRQHADPPPVRTWNDVAAETVGVVR